MVVLMTTLRNGRQGPAPGALNAPGWRHEPHAMHALDGADDIDAAEERPPARAGLVHEGEALEPDLLPERRYIAAEFAAVQLEAEHPQPVAQAQQPDEARIPGTLGFVHERNQLAQPPERYRVEAGDDHLALRHQDALGFAQHFVRIRMRLEDMRQCDEVHALRCDRQLQRVSGDAGARLEGERKTERNAVLSQEI